MHRVSLFYPFVEGGRFDHDDYEGRHIPLVLELLGSAIRNVTVERGIDAGPPWPPPAYVCVCHIHCTSLEDYQAVVVRHGARLQADLPNYSDVPPIIQVGRVTLSWPGPDQDLPD